MSRDGRSWTAVDYPGQGERDNFVPSAAYGPAGLLIGEHGPDAAIWRLDW